MGFSAQDVRSALSQPTNCAAASTGACLQIDGVDADCCTACGYGACAPGYTYAGQFLMDSEMLSSRYPDFYPSCLGSYYESYPIKLCGNTCCVPSNGTAQAMAGG